MPDQLIKGHKLVDNVWQMVTLSDDLTQIELPAGPVIVPAEAWLARREEWRSRCGSNAGLGVSIAPAFEIERIVDDLPLFELVAIEFPKFADGRGYSTARLLRERFGFTREIRAVGDVGRDQLFLLQRVGFDSFLIPAHRDANEALASFNDFPDAYQAAADQALPLFRRRAA